MTFEKSILAAIVAVSAMAFTAPALADGEIKYRQAVMKSIGGHMGAISGIIKKGTANRANLVTHAQGMADLAGIAATVFPEGSDFGETEALPAIWEKPEDFKKAVKMFEDAASAFNMAAKSDDMAQIGPAFGNLAKTCKNCHENFREKKQ